MVWVIAKTVPNKERHAREHLRKRGYVAEVPVENRWRRVSRHCHRRYTVEFPLLPRFVFLRGPDIPWLLLQRMNIITGYLEYAGKPATISDEVFEAFMEQSGKEFDPHAKRVLQINDLVKIAFGPNAGAQTKIVEIRGAYAWCPLELFNSTHNVKIPLAQLEAA
jgi:transcription antitermination factor NusG